LFIIDFFEIFCLLLIGELQTRLPHAASQHFNSPGQSVSNRQSGWRIFSVSHLPMASTNFGHEPNLRIGCERSIVGSNGSI